MTMTQLLLFCIALLQWHYQPVSSFSSLVATNPTTSSNVWINDNVQVWESLSEKKPNPFRTLVPLLGGKGCDVTVEWCDPQEGAREILAALSFEGQDTTGDAVKVLSDSLNHFRTVVEMEDGTTTSTSAGATSFKARVVATRGSQGTKCPRWHYDHVPLRHIQALVGPGCDYVVSEDGVDRLFLNEADECETDLINKDMVDISVADVRQGREGEAIILRGVEGSERPAVHKSPELPWWQGRLLLTVDIL
jgi:hypothetical protein